MDSECLPVQQGNILLMHICMYSKKIIERMIFMYCYVIWGKDKHGHTKKYLCKYNGYLEPGDVIWILDNRIYTALVREGLDELPIDSDSLKIQNIFCKNPEGTFPAKFAKSFFLALVDEYKDGEITKEKLTQIMEHFLVAIDSDLKSNSVLEEILCKKLPDASLQFKDESVEDKELAFGKELKDMEFRLKYGYSFWDTPKDHKEDPVEYTDEYLKIELELERLIRKQIGENEEERLGFCHLYWGTKKKILKEQFGIEWQSPAELNPDINFD